ncbi:Dabb family protein (plasmid) [Rhodococcus opacus]
MTVRHLFLWSVKDKQQGASVLAQLASLPEQIPGLKNWAIGEHIGDTPHASGDLRFDYALTCDFEDFDELQSYQNHPAHQAVVDRIMPLYADWAVADLELSPNHEKVAVPAGWSGKHS